MKKSVVVDKVLYDFLKVNKILSSKNLYYFYVPTRIGSGIYIQAHSLPVSL